MKRLCLTPCCMEKNAKYFTLSNNHDIQLQEALVKQNTRDNEEFQYATYDKKYVTYKKKP